MYLSVLRTWNTVLAESVGFQRPLYYHAIVIVSFQESNWLICKGPSIAHEHF